MVTPASLSGAYCALAVPAAKVDASNSAANIDVFTEASLLSRLLSGDRCERYHLADTCESLAGRKFRSAPHRHALQCRCARRGFALRPTEPAHDRAAHHPVLVVLGQERQLLGKVSDALLVGKVREAIDAGSEIGAPEA